MRELDAFIQVQRDGGMGSTSGDVIDISEEHASAIARVRNGATDGTRVTDIFDRHCESTRPASESCSRSSRTTHATSRS